MKTYLLNDFPSKLLLFVVLGVALPVLHIQAQEKVPIENLYKNAEHYHRQEVITEGTVIDYKQKISKKGNLYTVFKLSDGSYYVKAFSFGKIDLHNGEKARITGTFHKVKYVGRYKFYNEITIKKYEILEE